MRVPARATAHLCARRRHQRRAALIAALMVALAGCETISADSPELTLESKPLVEPAAPGTLDLAERALAEERYRDAKQLLERVLMAEPDNARAKLAAAELRLATGAPAPAAEAFETLIDEPQVRTRALQGQGIALMLTGKRAQGLASLEQAVAEDPTLWRAWNALGYYHDSRRDWAAAAECYGKALEGNPDSALIYNNRGFSMLMQERTEESIADLNRAIELDPDFEVAQENLRLALAWSGRYIHAMSGASERDMARLLNNIGFVALMRGDYANAEAYLLRAMEVDAGYNDVASRNLSYLRQVRELDKAESQAAEN